MKRTKNAYWYQIGYITPDREQHPLFVRYCKTPALTREFKHLLDRLERREIYGVFFNAFDPENQGLEPYEIQLTEYNF